MRTTTAILAAAFLTAAAAALSCRTEHPPGRDAVDSLSAGSAPGGTDTAEAEGASATLGRYRLDSAPQAVLSLPSSLREVSGIVFSGDGRLFAHDDERGTVAQVDTSTGNIVKRFDVGERRLREDFEDIAIVPGTFFLVNSRGELFSFVEGRDGEEVPYAAHPTRLGPRNDVEGLCFDPATGTLLLACKGDPGVEPGGTRAVHAFDTASRSLLPSPRFLIDLRELKERFGLRDFMPSGIGREPVSGNFYVLSSVGNSIIELSPGGKVLSYAPLPKKYHEQPEGIAFDGAGRLFIANESARKGRIAVYRPGHDGLDGLK